MTDGLSVGMRDPICQETVIFQHDNPLTSEEERVYNQRRSTIIVSESTHISPDFVQKKVTHEKLSWPFPPSLAVFTKSGA